MVGVELQKYPGGYVTSYKAEISTYYSSLQDTSKG